MALDPWESRRDRLVRLQLADWQEGRAGVYLTPLGIELACDLLSAFAEAATVEDEDTSMEALLAVNVAGAAAAVLALYFQRAVAEALDESPGE